MSSTTFDAAPPDVPAVVTAARPDAVPTDIHAPLAATGLAAFIYTAKRAGVIWAGLFALGIGFGVLVAGHGLAWWLAPVISGLVFAGSVEFLLIGLLATAAPLGTIAMTTFLVNSRHLFYGLSYPLERIRTKWGRGYSIFALCDEAFAMASASRPDDLHGARLVWLHAGLHVSWVMGSLTGAVLGRAFLADVEGLDFILTALFVVLALDAFRARPDRATLALASGAAVVALLLVPGSMVLAAMTAFTATLVIRHLLQPKEGRRA